MSELIEQFGGYEVAKQAVKNYRNSGDKVSLENLEHVLLEYRRKNNIFEVGDYVFHTICKNPLLECITWIDGTRIMTDIANGSAPIESFIHATDEEIKQGRRL